MKKIKYDKKPMKKHDKMIYAGLGLILLGLLVGGVYGAALMLSPGGQFVKTETGISQFLNKEINSIYIDDTLSTETEQYVQELARHYNIEKIEVLTQDTIDIKNSIVFAKKENPNLLVLEQRLGWESRDGDALVRISDENQLLYVIGDENSLKDASTVLKDKQCQVFSNGIVIVSGPVCEQIRAHQFCLI